MVTCGNKEPVMSQIKRKNLTGEFKAKVALIPLDAVEKLYASRIRGESSLHQATTSSCTSNLSPRYLKVVSNWIKLRIAESNCSDALSEIISLAPSLVMLSSSAGISSSSIATATFDIALMRRAVAS